MREKKRAFFSHTEVVLSFHHLLQRQTGAQSVGVTGSHTVEPQSYEPPGNEGVHKSEMSVTLKSSTTLKILCCSLQFS